MPEEADSPARPPEPTEPTFTPGVVGHRNLKNKNAISTGVALALDRLDDRVPEGVLVLLSSLAEGADRLVVRLALTRPRVSKLITVLPMPESHYITDFPNIESREEFTMLKHRASEVIVLTPQPGTPRGEAYAAAGLYILDHCDVLLAVWDGLPARGRGGTGEIVEEARKRGMPLAWVHAGEDAGAVTFERF